MGHAGIPSVGAWDAGADAFGVAEGFALGLAAADAVAAGADVAAPGVALVAAPEVWRGGQITPSHSRSLHLKSGAFGLRLPSRLSHIGPSHRGQVGRGVDWSEDG